MRVLMAESVAGLMAGLMTESVAGLLAGLMTESGQDFATRVAFPRPML